MQNNDFIFDLSAEQIVFTSDTHFGHANIINYCERPFQFPDIDQMDELMLGYFHEADEAGKTIVHLGDFTFNPINLINSKWRPKGQHWIILGNHDKYANVGGKYRTLYHEYFYNILGVSHRWRTECFKAKVNHYPILLSHEPQKLLRGCMLNIYGHHHNNMIRNPEYFKEDYDWIFDNPKYINVGVELTEYRPVTLEEAKQLPRPRKPV